MYDLLVGQFDNVVKEWDLDMGVFVKNFDVDDVMVLMIVFGVIILDSGVINYINKFGEMNDGNDKSFDFVSEMYYVVICYFKNQSVVVSYLDIVIYFDGFEYKMVDGFLVIIKVVDLIKYFCQKNFIFGIGDVNIYWDKNFFGNMVIVDEFVVLVEVVVDKMVDVVKVINQIVIIEGI